MSTINASPAFLDSDGLAKGFMAWQHTFFFPKVNAVCGEVQWIKYMFLKQNQKKKIK